MKHLRFLIRILSALICTVVLLNLLTFEALAVTYPYDTVAMDDVNLRRYANSKSTVLKKIAFGDTVTVLGVSGNYYHIKYDSVTGYAMKVYIDGTSNDEDEPVSAGINVAPLTGISGYPYDTIVISRVKLRKKAGTTADTIKTLTVGTAVTVYSLTDNGFAKVKTGGKTGYVLSSHINVAQLPQATAVPTATPVPGSEKYTELKKGSTGDMVSALQSALAELGYLSEDAIDGKFGAKTESALKTFQKRNGLTQNGIASAELQLTLFEGTPKNYKGYRQNVNTVPTISGALVRADSKGTIVTKIQERLKELGYYQLTATGLCDEETVAAIKLFEGYNGLNADGQLDSDDQAVLYSAAAVSYSTAATVAPTSTVQPITKTLRKGDKGSEVKVLQTRLKELGYYSGNITGTFGTETETALIAFQKKNKLEADGVLGAISRTVLLGQNPISALAEATVAPTATYAPITKENVVVIRSGSRGDYVLRLQQRLQDLGYYTSRLDGVYLSTDIEAVRAFQKANGLTVDGTAGYETQKILYSESAVSATTTESNESLRYGDSGNNVIVLQNRLIELGYLSGKADGIFGNATKLALQNFQKANNLSADGIAGADTMAALYSTNVVSNKLSTYTTLRIGSTGSAVTELQNRLITLGYLSGKADGIFGTKTSAALIAFQKANNLLADGVAGTNTIKKLNSTTVVASSGDTTTTTVLSAISSDGVTASQVQYAYWYDGLRDKCKQYPNATVYDFTTGISWQVNMFSFGKHADCEPLTAEDTANMNRAFGGKTTWTPKAVWVILSDGSVYMASTHNTPHGTYHIKDNNFAGHMCIHFPRTQAQVESIGPYATSHQKAIDLGWEATKLRAK